MESCSCQLLIFMRKLSTATVRGILDQCVVLVPSQDGTSEALRVLSRKLSPHWRGSISLRMKTALVPPKKSSIADANGKQSCQVEQLHLRINMKNIYRPTETSQHPTRGNSTCWAPRHGRKRANQSYSEEVNQENTQVEPTQVEDWIVPDEEIPATHLTESYLFNCEHRKGARTKVGVWRGEATHRI